jgi:hypothetical protein
MAYNAFLERPALTKFLVIPHYAYLVLKVSGPNRVISIKGDVKRGYDCDKESCEMADWLMASKELQEFNKALVEAHPDLIMPKAKTSQTSIQLEYSLNKMIPQSLEEPSKVACVENSVDLK